MDKKTWDQLRSIPLIDKTRDTERIVYEDLQNRALLLIELNKLFLLNTAYAYFDIRGRTFNTSIDEIEIPLTLIIGLRIGHVSGESLVATIGERRALEKDGTVDSSLYVFPTPRLHVVEFTKTSDDRIIPRETPPQPIEQLTDQIVTDFQVPYHLAQLVAPQ